MHLQMWRSRQFIIKNSKESEFLRTSYFVSEVRTVFILPILSRRFGKLLLKKAKVSLKNHELSKQQCINIYNLQTHDVKSVWQKNKFRFVSFAISRTELTWTERTLIV